MALLWINNISISFGGPQLIDGASPRLKRANASGFWDETVRASPR